MAELFLNQSEGILLEYSVDFVSVGPRERSTILRGLSGPAGNLKTAAPKVMEPS